MSTSGGSGGGGVGGSVGGSVGGGVGGGDVGGVGGGGGGGGGTVKATSEPPSPWLLLPTLAAALLLYRYGSRGWRWRSWNWSKRQPRKLAVGIIPARFRSSRFQGKPLALILGKPMIQRTWEQAKLASSLDAVVVATDDEQIASCCRRFGADVVMTSESCRNGTERCHEALQKLQKEYDVVVNIQGDEPLIDPCIIDGVVKALQGAPDAVFSTAVASLKLEDAEDVNRVKCVVDNRGYAIYFSRGLIPYNKKGVASPDFSYLLHLGIQCYDAKFLGTYCAMPATPLQVEEDLEQLKVLENGYRMKVIKVEHDGHGVDTPSDIASIEALMRKKGMM